MLDRNGTPNHLNMRKDKRPALNALLDDARKQLYALWEIEWVDDGTLPMLGLEYVAVHEDGREKIYPNFVSAMLAVWPAGTKEAAGHVDYIKPEWMREAEAMQAEYADDRDTLAGLLQF